MALTATAAATALLPQLTQLMIQERGDELRDVMGMTKRLEIVLMAPAMVGLMVFGLPIVTLVYEHGEWTSTASRATYLALLCYAPGLLPLGWNRLLEPLFFARHDRVTPLKAAAAAFALNIALNYVFAFHTRLNQMGLALAYTLSAFLNYFLLSWFLERKIPGVFGAESRIGETLLKSLLCAGVACGLGWLAYLGLARLWGEPANVVSRAVLLLPTMAAVAALYFLLVRIARVPDADQAIAGLTRRLRRR
jgi:putative peptidoglycan lipid II flippase